MSLLKLILHIYTSICVTLHTIHERMQCRMTDQVTCLSVALVAISLAYVGAIMALIAITGGNAASGYLAIFGASIVFSTTTIPMKAPALLRLEVEGLLFALLTGAGIFAISIPLCVYLSTTQEGFRFEPWSLCAATAIFSINLFAIQAIQSPLGVATGPGVWAGIGMVWSFLLGSFAFEEEIRDTQSAALGVALLAVGVYGVSTSKTGPDAAENKAAADKSSISSAQQDQASLSLASTMPGPEALMPPGDDGLELAVRPLGEGAAAAAAGDASADAAAVRVDFKIDHTPPPPAPQSPQTSLAVGLCCCCIVGLLDGALMAPFKLTLSMPGREGGKKVHATLCYLASFGLSAGVVSPVLYLGYCCAKRAAEFNSAASLLPPRAHVEAAWLPGLCSGVLWAAANLLSVFGTALLGMAISFPLTQTCALFAAAWGVCYFKEPVARKGRFALGLVCVVLGAWCLASSKG